MTMSATLFILFIFVLIFRVVVTSMMSFSRHIRSLTSFTRGFQTSSALSKNDKPRFKVRTGLSDSGSTKSTARRESVTQMRAAASRTKWEAEKAASEKVKGLHPLPSQNVYFTSAFEQPQLPLLNAVAMLREAAVPEMFDCETNPLYAKVKFFFDKS